MALEKMENGFVQAPHLKVELVISAQTMYCTGIGTGLPGLSTGWTLGGERVPPNAESVLTIKNTGIFLLIC